MKVQIVNKKETYEVQVLELDCAGRARWTPIAETPSEGKAKRLLYYILGNGEQSARDVKNSDFFKQNFDKL